MKRFAVVALLALAGLPLRASEIDSGVNAARHRRFTGGFDTGVPTNNAGALGGGLDLSGVGWSAADRTWGVALISPKHFAIATHVLRAGGEQLRFLNRDGVVKTYTIKGVGTAGYTRGSYNGGTSDVAIGELVETVTAADNVKIYDVLRPGGMPPTAPDLNNPPNPAGLNPALAWFVGKSVVAVGKNESAAGVFNPLGGKVSRDTIAEVGAYSLTSATTPDTLGYSWVSSATTADSGRLVGGDSGSPSFVQHNGELYFLGSHSGIDPSIPGAQLNVGGFFPWYVDSFNASIAGTGFQIGIINPVPEPGTGLLACAGLAAAWTVRRRRPSTAPRRLPAART
jgi:hypothetical protein